MSAFEPSHLTLQRLAEIALGEPPTVHEAAHIITCQECGLLIEREDLLSHEIADFRRRKQGAEDL